jgi:hypothetical protein
MDIAPSQPRDSLLPAELKASTTANSSVENQTDTESSGSPRILYLDSDRLHMGRCRRREQSRDGATEALPERLEQRLDIWCIHGFIHPSTFIQYVAGPGEA